MSLSYKNIGVLLWFFIGQSIFCPDEGHFFTLIQRRGPHHEVRVRVDMPHSQREDVIDVLEHYFSYSRRPDHPFIQATNRAQIRSRLRNGIIEEEGIVRASNDHLVPFKVSYGFNSEQEASVQGVGRQICPSEIKMF